MLSMFNPYYEYFSMHPPHFPLTIDPVQESFELCSPPWIIDRLHRWFKVYRKPFCNISFLPLKNQRKSWPYCFDLLLMIFQLKLTQSQIYEVLKLVKVYSDSWWIWYLNCVKYLLQREMRQFNAFINRPSVISGK